MNTAGRLGAYGAALAVVFAGAFAGAGALAPADVAAGWARSAAQEHEAAPEGEKMNQSTAAGGKHSAHPVQGVTVEQGGYVLQKVSAPSAMGEEGELSFTITGPDGAPVTDFETGHGKDLHLIVVRSDGTGFRHVHPVMDQAGRWSLPWQWEAAGTYRLYADIAPAGADSNITLTRTVDVAGTFNPAAPEVSTTDEVQGFDISLEGDLSAGSASALTINVARDGQPVTTLEPYLGAYGHLVALRAGDLAYLHVHPEGAEPAEGEVSGPQVDFAATAPTPGRYYLYFDFQVDGTVHSARFVLDTTGSTHTATDAGTADDGHGGH